MLAAAFYEDESSGRDLGSGLVCGDRNYFLGVPFYRLLSWLDCTRTLFGRSVSPSYLQLIVQLLRVGCTETRYLQVMILILFVMLSGVD